MKSQTTCVLYGMELKKGGEYQGKAFLPSTIFHLDVDMAGSQNKDVFGVVTRGFKQSADMGERIRHLGKSLPIQVEAEFDVTAGTGPDGKPTVNIQLVDLKPVAQVKKAA